MEGLAGAVDWCCWAEMSPLRLRGCQVALAVIVLFPSGGLACTRASWMPAPHKPADLPVALTPLGVLVAPVVVPAYSLVLGAVLCLAIGFVAGNYELPVEQGPPSTVESSPVPSTLRPSESGAGSASQDDQIEVFSQDVPQGPVHGPVQCYPGGHLQMRVRCTQGCLSNRSGKYRNAPTCDGLRSAKSPIVATTVLEARSAGLTWCLVCCPGW